MALERLVEGKVKADTKQVVVKLAIPIAEEIDRIAKEKGFTKNEVVCELIEGGLAAYKKLEEKMAKAKSGGQIERTP
jgi:metal-responsive CopG/Arc/MetJ family transcriptional regulator